MATEIQPTLNDIQFRRITKELLPRFRGKLGSFAFVTDDKMRMVVFDGKTLGGASQVALLNSADFTVNPTVPNLENLEDIPDETILNVHDIKEVITNTSEETNSNKIDHTILKETGDLNTETEDGFYHILNASNTPDGNDGYLLVYANGSTLTQIWITSKNADSGKIPEVYVRLKGDVSTSWFKIITSAELNIDDLAYLSKDNTFYQNIEIQGELTGPTIERKIDHTSKSTVANLDLLKEDGFFYISSSSSITNSPDNARELFVHVRSLDGLIMQEALLLDGRLYFRNNKSGTFSSWISQSSTVEIVHATDSTFGIVKISDTPKSGDNETALSVGGAFTINENANQAKQDAEQAKQDASDAKQTAESLEKEISTIKSDVTQAKQDATTAKQTAEEAKQEIEGFREDVEQAKQDASSAKETANTASQTATSASEKADTAQQQANTNKEDIAEIKQKLEEIEQGGVSGGSANIKVVAEDSLPPDYELNTLYLVYENKS